ncbi:MAG: substrate-binding domain-containing protein [Lentisphaeria bacterium]|nr:substrate-binding domain-containing protein [Lentisphaeria bacterium]
MPASKSDEILKKLHRELASGKLGLPGSAFLTVRELSSSEKISLKTAFRIIRTLREENLIRREGRSYKILRVSPALSGVRRNNMLIGFVATCLESPFFAKLACHAEEMAHSAGASLIIASSNYDFETEKERLGMFVKQGVSGIMICPWAATEKEEAFYRTLSVPFVLLGRKLQTLSCDAVLVDNLKAGARMAHHLYGEGIREFAYIGQAGKLQDARLSGFRAGLMENSVPEKMLKCCFLDINSPQACRKTILALLKKRSGKRLGIFCYHDLFAVKVILCCAELSIKIPEEVSVAGFDDLPAAKEIFPPLTSVSYPVSEMARIAFETLYAKIRFGSSPEGGIARYVDSKCVFRESTVTKKPSKVHP